MFHLGNSRAQIIAGSVFATGLMMVAAGVSAQWVLPTYDHDSTPFPRSPLVQPAEVVRFRPAQFMTTLYVDKEQVDAVLERSGWVSSGIFDAHDDARLTGVQAYWELRTREHFQGVRDSQLVGGRTIYGPYERFYLGVAAKSLADPSLERYLFLLWIEEHDDSALRLNDVFGHPFAAVAQVGTIDIRLRCKTGSGSCSVLLASLRAAAPAIGFSFAYDVRLPSDVPTHQVTDDPIGISGAMLNTATGFCGPTLWKSDRSVHQLFVAGTTPGFKRKLPSSASLRLPGGWQVDVEDYSDRFDYYIDVESVIRRAD